MKKPAISTATIVDPTGVPASIEIRMSSRAQLTENIAEQIVTALKLLNTRIADSAGKITRAEIRSDPTRFIDSTMITATTMTIIKLYNPAFVPVARAKFSSNVTENILL